MGKDPAMQWYVNDWLSSHRVQSMTPAQELAYARLLMFCWASQDASIPDDDHVLAGLTRMGKGWLKGGSTVVRKCFKQHPTKPNHLTNERLYKLWKERQEWKEKSSRGGKTSGRSRCSKRTLKGGSTKRQPNANTSSSSSSSSSSGIDVLDSSSSSMDGVRGMGEGDRFEEFWDAYPPGRKTAKGDAKAAWKKAITKATPDRIIAAAAEYAQSEVAATRFVQGPAPWLNQECWDDDREAWKEKRDVVTKPKLSELLK